MGKRGTTNRQPSRAELETLLSADLRAITAQSDRIGRYFASQNDLSHGDFHALLHIMVAETAGAPLNLAQLRQRLDFSAPAVTYLVDRMIDAGHIRREPHPDDRRKSLLRYENSGMALAHQFFRPLGMQLHAAFAELPDGDLHAARRVFTAMIAAMTTFEDSLHTAPAKSPSARGDNDSKATPGRRKPSAGSR